MAQMQNCIVSGQTIPDTENAAAFATRIAHSTKHRRSCGIAIVNCTKRKLVDPKLHVYAGSVMSRPAVINPNCTGLVLAEKIFASTWGAVGLITYAIEGTDKKLQVYYSVPLHRLFFNVQTNVMVGFKSASKDLFEDMHRNLYGEQTLARWTMRSKKNVEGYDFDILMEDVEKSPLSVILRDHTPHKENRNANVTELEDD